MTDAQNPYANFIDKLSPVAKKWFAMAIAGSITADGVVDDQELDFLRVAISFLDSKADIEELILLTKDRKTPKVQQLRGQNRIIAFKMFLAVAKITAADNLVTNSEKEYLKMVGGKLGFKKDVILKVLDWLEQSIRLNLAKQLIKDDEAKMNDSLSKILKIAMGSNEEYT